MMEIDIVSANEPQEFELVAVLADQIWREHYTAIIGEAQVDYMLEKFQSVDAIRSQVKEGYEYFIIHSNDEAVGYISIKQEEEALFLSKIYVSSLMRGKGIGKAALEFVERLCAKYNLPKVRLTVNKFNTNSKKAYEKMGFEDKGSVVIDIGNGFVMDDYAMEKTI